MSSRLVSIDRIRSFALISLVFLHSAVYHYSRIFAVIDNPPPMVAVMGLFVLFGGAFIMMSGLVNTHVALERFRSGERGAGKISLDLVITGTLMLILHFLYNLLFGPASFDWEAETKAIALIPAWLDAEGTFDSRRLLEGSSLSTIGTNLILMGLLLRLLLNEKILGKKRQYWILGLVSLAFFSFAFFRYLYYPLAAAARTRGAWGSALVLGILLEKPYPVLPYASFAIFGMILAFTLKETRAKTILKSLAILGLLVIVGGVVCYIIIPPSLSAVTGSWFARVLIESGLFLIIGSLALLNAVPDSNRHVRSPALGLGLGLKKADAAFRSFGAAALTVFLIETPLSELVAKLWDLALPLWREEIGSVMLFAAGNAILWVILLALWRKSGYKFSFDRLLARFQNSLGRKSDRTDLSAYEPS